MRRTALLTALLVATASPAFAEGGWAVETSTDVGTGVETVTASVAGEAGARLVIACRNGLRTMMALVPGQIPLPSGNQADALVTTSTDEPVRLPVVLIDRGAATLVAATVPTAVPTLIERLRAADGPLGLVVTKGGTEHARQAFVTQGAAAALATLDTDCPPK